VYRALKRLYNLGIFPEWWKLEPMDAAQWRDVDALIAERDPYCRGVVLLGQNASIDTLAKAFRDARGSATCRGFAVGRTVFEKPSAEWLAGEIDDEALKRAIRARFEALIDAWQEARAPLTTAESWSQCRAETELGSETSFREKSSP
jgi:5-dehydro-2-deoxygluconokinase